MGATAGRWKSMMVNTAAVGKSRPHAGSLSLIRCIHVDGAYHGNVVGGTDELAKI